MQSKILIIGSADEYGLVQPEENPITENLRLQPSSPYGLSKLTQDMMGYVYAKSYNMHIVRVRPFNHIGPRQSPQFVVPAFAKQIAEAEAGIIEPIIKVGNLSAQRDFTNVKDMMHAYWLAITKGESGEVYNIGSGKAYAISWILEKLISMAKIEIKTEVDPLRLRPSDLPITVCDNTKFVQKTRWSPSISIEDTLSETLEYWREKIKSGR